MLYDIALFTDEKQMNRKDRKARIIPMLRWSARIAAVVIVAISFGFLFKNYQYEKSACQQTITVPAGQRAQITLAGWNQSMVELQIDLNLCIQLRS